LNASSAAISNSAAAEIVFLKTPIFEMVAAAGIEADRFFRVFSFHCISIGVFSCRNFLITNQNASK
jgi:hypothetical protein